MATPVTAARASGHPALQGGRSGSSTRPVRWIAGNGLHNLLVLLDLPRRLPLPAVGLGVVAILASSSFLFASPGLAGIVLALVGAGDLALLLALPRLRISFGPVAPAWTLFTVGRALVSVLVCLPPFGAGVQTALLALLQLGLSAAAFWGAVVEPLRLEETRLTLRLAGLDGSLRLLLLSDLHLERTTRREERVLEAAGRERPDLILVAGDLLNLSFLYDDQAVADARCFLARLAACCPPGRLLLVRGTGAVDAADLVERTLDGLPVRALEGESLRVSVGRANLQVLGLPADRPHDELRRWLRALAETAPPGPRLCLHHTPDLAPEAARLGVDLYLAGHTHGGQICLPGLGPLATASRFGRRYYRGYHRLGPTQIYVSRGLGMEGLGAPRMRFLSRPELVWLSLDPPR